MAGLGDTTAMLRRLRRASPPAAGSGASTPMRVTTAFGANPGGLEMLSYVPEGLQSDAPLVVVLHGCGQGAADYASNAGWLTLADRLGFAVLAPQQTAANNPGRCFNWFSLGDVRRGEGEAASIAAMVAFMVRSEGLDAGRVFITGLSAGGAMTLAMLAAYPELFAAGGVIAGLPYGVANDMMHAMTVMHAPDPRSAAELGRLIPVRHGSLPRLTVWHGAADGVVSPGNGEAIARQWAAAQGLSPTPDQTASQAGRTRRVWRGKGDREPALELNLIEGMGHGVPLATRGEDGLGETAPYMLEAGISSSSEIARFWRLDPAARTSGIDNHAPPKRRPDALEDPAPSTRWMEDADQLGGGLGDRVLSAVRQHVPSRVHDVIAGALQKAGLMK